MGSIRNPSPFRLKGDVRPMEFNTLIWKREESVVHLTLNRPKAFNALNEEMARELFDAIGACDADDSIRAVTLTGAGKAYCAGGDVVTFSQDPDATPALLKRITTDLHGALSRMTRMKKPVIAAINGTVAGGGFGPLLAPDLAIASDKATFTVAYTGIGATPWSEVRISAYRARPTRSSRNATNSPSIPSRRR